jgi:hypothetical protein
MAAIIYVLYFPNHQKVSAQIMIYLFACLDGGQQLDLLQLDDRKQQVRLILPVLPFI